MMKQNKRGRLITLCLVFLLAGCLTAMTLAAASPKLSNSSNQQGSYYSKNGWTDVEGRLKIPPTWDHSVFTDNGSMGMEYIYIYGTGQGGSFTMTFGYIMDMPLEIAQEECDSWDEFHFDNGQKGYRFVFPDSVAWVHADTWWEGLIFHFENRDDRFIFEDNEDYISAVAETLSYAGDVPADDGAIRIYVDGVKLNMDVPPRIINDRTMVPVRAVTEAVGCIVEWIPEGRHVQIDRPDGSRLLDMRIDEPVATVFLYDEDGNADTQSVTLDSPPVIIDDRTLVPLRFIAEAIGYEVEWVESTRTVLLIKPWEPEGGAEFPKGISYSEEIDVDVRDIDGLSPFNAAMRIVREYKYDEFAASDDSVVSVEIALIDLGVINDEDCYIFSIYIGGEYLRCAVEYSGVVHMFEG